MFDVSGWKRAGLAVGLAVSVGFVSAISGNALGNWLRWLDPIQATQAEEARGESYLLFEVARPELIEELAVALRDEIGARLRKAAIAYTELAVADGAVQVRISNAAEVGKAKEALAGLLAPRAPAEGAAPMTEVFQEEPEPALLKYALTQPGIEARVGAAAEGTLGVMKRRLREYGIGDPAIRREAADRIAVEVHGLHDPDRLRDALGQRAKLTLQWVDASTPAEAALSGRPPEGSSILYSVDDAIPFLIEDRVVLSGANLADAQASMAESTGEPVITLRFDEEGTRLFGEATRQNIGRALAIVLDGKVMMAPTILEPITGGTAQIFGNFTVASTSNLALLLRTGALPAKLNLIEIRFKPL